MCFSAAASFVGGTVLTSIGIATTFRNQSPARRLFAAIPLVFGAQQISEGIVWHTLQNPGNDRLLAYATTFFLFTALIAWPVMVPLAIYRMEEHDKRKEPLRLLAMTGMVVAALHAYALATCPASARISGFHIQYGLPMPTSILYAASLGYIMATILPMFIASVRRIHHFGFVILISYVATFYFYREYLTSVWCFFAALSSVIIWFIIREPSLADERASSAIQQS